MTLYRLYIPVKEKYNPVSVLSFPKENVDRKGKSGVNEVIFRDRGTFSPFPHFEEKENLAENKHKWKKSYYLYS